MSVSLAVVVPTLDEEVLLPRLLERLAGTGADAADRVVVADGGSRDRTAEIARAAGCDVVETAAGRGGQLAAGARAAREDVLLFLHADTLPEPGALAALRAAYSEPTVEATAMSQRIEAPGAFYRAVERFADVRSGRLGVVYGDCGLAVRRALYTAVGGFRPLALFEDVDLSRRLRARTRIRLVRGARLSISPRRWKSEGALSCTLRNWMLLVAYAAGRDPERLARRYPPHAAGDDPR